MSCILKSVRGSNAFDLLVNYPHLKNPKKAREKAVSRTRSSYAPKKPDLRVRQIWLKIDDVIGSLGLTMLS